MSHNNNVNLFDVRLSTFKRGCERIVYNYLNNECEEGYGSSNYATSGIPVTFTIIKTKMYAKIQGHPRHDMAQVPKGYTFAMVELSTGNVYRPSSALDGSLNKSKAIIKGNIFDSDNGLTRITAHGPL